MISYFIRVRKCECEIVEQQHTSAILKVPWLRASIRQMTYPQQLDISSLAVLSWPSVITVVTVLTSVLQILFSWLCWVHYRPALHGLKHSRRCNIFGSWVKKSQRWSVESICTSLLRATSQHSDDAVMCPDFLADLFTVLFISQWAFRDHWRRLGLLCVLIMCLQISLLSIYVTVLYIKCVWFYPK